MTTLTTYQGHTLQNQSICLDNKCTTNQVGRSCFIGAMMVTGLFKLLQTLPRLQPMDVQDRDSCRSHREIIAASVVLLGCTMVMSRPFFVLQIVPNHVHQIRWRTRLRRHCSLSCPQHLHHLFLRHILPSYPRCLHQVFHPSCPLRCHQVFHPSCPPRCHREPHQKCPHRPLQGCLHRPLQKCLLWFRRNSHLPLHPRNLNKSLNKVTP